jgi:hypothetical protein
MSEREIKQNRSPTGKKKLFFLHEKNDFSLLRLATDLDELSGAVPFERNGPNQGLFAELNVAVARESHHRANRRR